ncbi:lysylphosphatidylglycerol synthase transmembrane domain-containing protein [Tautonia sociabilis]|uniref:Flippase-like domain-containing protein n=1 Tax=Tautonia sociabilis TaxID=2080755 RepID=A0A432MHS2_9BACT|nr:lysylphosphatidylglycerol synthase transmembrane domain-containing protein [Tautonia sociabilis]RUL86478.1 flippase-like domain-containing protein [Tautonia sociabilis]
MTPPSRNSRPLLGYVVRLAIGLGLLGLAIWANREQIGQVLERRPDFALFGVGFALYFAGVILAFVRWYFLVRALGLPFRMRDAMRLGFIGLLFNMVVPGAVGGDFVKAAYLMREQSRKTQAAASVAIDRLIGLLGMFILAVAVGAFAWGGVEPPVRRLIGAAMFMTLAVTGVMAVAFAPPLYRPLATRLAHRRRISHALHELAVMGSAYRRRMDVVLATVVMSSLTHVLNVLAFMIIGRSIFPVVPGLAQHFLIVPLVLFSTAIPLPFGALGVSEQISDVLFRLADYDGGALTMMAFHVAQYLGSLIALFVYLANARQVRSLTEEAPRASDEAAPTAGGPHHTNRLGETTPAGH